MMAHRSIGEDLSPSAWQTPRAAVRTNSQFSAPSIFLTLREKLDSSRKQATLLTATFSTREERTRVNGTSLIFVEASDQLCHFSYSWEVDVLMSVTEMKKLKLRG